MGDPQPLDVYSPTYDQRNKQQGEALGIEIQTLAEQNPTTKDESNAQNKTTALTEAANQIVDFIIPKNPNSPKDFKSLYEEIEKTFKTTTIKRIHNEAEKNLGSSDIIARTDAYLQAIKLLSKEYFRTSENDKANLESLRNRLDSFWGENNNEDSICQHLEEKAGEQIDNATAFKNNLKRRPKETFNKNEQELKNYCKEMFKRYSINGDWQFFDDTQKLLLETCALSNREQQPELLKDLAFDFASNPQTDSEREIIIEALNIIKNQSGELGEFEKKILQMTVNKTDSLGISDEFSEELLQLCEKNSITIPQKRTYSSSTSVKDEFYSKSKKNLYGDDDYDEYDYDDEDEDSDEEETSIESSARVNQTTATDSKTATAQTQPQKSQQDQPQEKKADEPKEFVSASVTENRKMKALLDNILPQQSGIQVEIINAPPPQPRERVQTDENSTSSPAQAAPQNSTSSTQPSQQAEKDQEAFLETSLYYRKSQKSIKPLPPLLMLGVKLDTAGICTGEYFKKLKKIAEHIKTSCSKGIGKDFLKDVKDFYRRNQALIKSIEEDGSNSPLYNDKLMISNNIECIIRKVMRSLIELYKTPEESERKKRNCTEALRNLMGFLRTKEDPKVNEQKNRERNLASATDEQSRYLAMSAAYIVARGENREQIEASLGQNKELMDLMKKAKFYREQDDYGSSKRKVTVQKMKEIILTLTRFIGLSLRVAGKITEKTNDYKKYFDENSIESLRSKICDRATSKAGDSQYLISLKNDVLTVLKNDIKGFDWGISTMKNKIVSILNSSSDFNKVSKEFGGIFEDMKTYYESTIKNNTSFPKNEDFRTLGTSNPILYNYVNVSSKNSSQQTS